ncbi:MAG TPA: GspH/FimT family pseudopilin [Blastocatellia bacterium]|nr:GspH/FimT family pseudopilin [Blastocatellia bacterium]
MRNHTIRAASLRTSEAGISLVETAIVCLLILIVLAFALPMVNNSIQAYNLRSAANHLAERIAATRAMAMAKNDSVTFSFNNSSGLYGFDFHGAAVTDPPDGVPDTVDPVERTITYPTFRLPDGVTATFPNNEPIKIEFNSRGELPIGSTERSIVIRSGSRMATVHVNLRGKIVVQ